MLVFPRLPAKAGFRRHNLIAKLKCKGGNAEHGS